MENNKRPTLSNGKVCYIEIPAIDINSSAAFYKNVFDWKIRQRGDGNLAFDDNVGEVSGTWVRGRTASTGTTRTPRPRYAATASRIGGSIPSVRHQSLVIAIQLLLDRGVRFLRRTTVPRVETAPPPGPTS